MAISVKEMLAFPLFREARLLAGKEGMQRPIRWATILEVLDDINHLKEDELLITTAFDLLSSPDLQQNLIKELSHKKLAGIVIQTGYYLEAIPESLLRDSEQLHFPLIEIPRTITFSEITRLLHKEIIYKQYEKIEFSEKLYRRLTDIALKNEGLKPIANLVRELIHGDIRIFDVNMNELSNKDRDAGKSHKTATEADIPNDVLFDYIAAFRQSLEAGGTPHQHIRCRTSFLFLVPIQAGETLYGFLAAVKLEDELDEFQQIAVHHAATICAFEFIKLYGLEEKDNKLKGDFLELLLSDDETDGLTVHSRGEALGYRLGSYDTCVAVIALDRFDQLAEPDKIRSKLFQTILKKMLDCGLQTLFKQFSDHFVVLITNRYVKRVDIAEVIRDIGESAAALFGVTLSAGIGGYYQHFSEYKLSYKEAQEALFIVQAVWKKNKCMAYGDLGMYRLLAPIMKNQPQMASFHERILGEVADNEELLDTLKLYLEHMPKVNEVAEKLFIHRHTLKYRLNKIEELTGKKLSQFQDRLELELAVLMRRIIRKDD